MQLSLRQKQELVLARLVAGVWWLWVVMARGNTVTGAAPHYSNTAAREINEGVNKD